MKNREISRGIYELSAGIVKVYLIEHEGSLTLIDTALPGTGEKILETIESLGYKRTDLKHILITHFHTDHIGSLQELKEKTGALIYVHKKEAETIGRIQNIVPAPGLFRTLMYYLFIKRSQGVPQPELPVDRTLVGGEILDFAGGLIVVPTPGHTAGHTSYLMPREGGILFTGDAASGGKTPGYPMLFSDREEAMKTLIAIGRIDFRSAYFSHGKSIESKAPQEFRKVFG